MSCYLIGPILLGRMILQDSFFAKINSNLRMHYVVLTLVPALCAGRSQCIAKTLVSSYGFKGLALAFVVAKHRETGNCTRLNSKVT